jgi:ABC-type Zn2+ transport system substrate-binding protein/surface adhesin
MVMMMVMIMVFDDDRQKDDGDDEDDDDDDYHKHDTGDDDGAKRLDHNVLCFAILYYTILRSIWRNLLWTWWGHPTRSGMRGFCYPLR